MPTKKSNVLAPKTKEHLISTLSHFDNEEMSLIMAWVYGKSKNTQRYCRRILLDFFSHFPNTSLKSINRHTTRETKITRALPTSLLQKKRTHAF